MIVDCTTCPVRGQRCDDCVVTVLLAPASGELPLDAAERKVVSTFVNAGLASVEAAAGLFARHEPMDFGAYWESAEAWGAAGAVG